MEKAWKRAADDRKARFEEVLLRIDAGTDAREAEFEGLRIATHEVEVLREKGPDGKPCLHVRVVFSGTNGGDEEVTVTFKRATLHAPGGKTGLLVRGTKGEAFTRTFDPGRPKYVSYGAIIPPRHAPGTRVVVAFELARRSSVKRVRTPIAVISERKE